jgi:hypothetical protein
VDYLQWPTSYRVVLHCCSHMLKISNEQSCLNILHFAKDGFARRVKIVVLVSGLVRYRLPKTSEEARRHCSDRTS